MAESKRTWTYLQRFSEYLPTRPTSKAEEKMNGLTGGKLKLIQAALRLITETRSLTSLGLRELAREAGLNPALQEPG